MEIFLGWLFFSALVGALGASRGRSGFGWFLLSIILSPLLAGIVLALLPSRNVGPTPETHVKCPDCRELVLKEANVCKHCGAKLIPLK